MLLESMSSLLISLSLSLSLSLYNNFAVLRVEDVSINGTNERISLIEGENARISIPREVIASVKGRESVRVIFFLYRNMSGLLPESLEGIGVNDR